MFLALQSEVKHHLLLQSVLAGPGYCQCVFSSLQLFQLVLQKFHSYLQVKGKVTGSYSALPVDTGLVD